VCACRCARTFTITWKLSPVRTPLRLEQAILDRLLRDDLDGDAVDRCLVRAHRPAWPGRLETHN
jgi:hypothetical protein